jgi:hypothetical protein
MKASEYIKQIEALIAEHGDLEVMTYGMSQMANAAMSAYAPQLAYKAILNSRERQEKFYSQYCDEPSRKGEKVIKI